MEPQGAALDWVFQLVELIGRSKVQGSTVAMLFMVRWCQPIKQRDHPGYEYTGDDDGTREVTEPISAQEFERRQNELFDLWWFVRNQQTTKPFFINRKPPPVSVRQNA